MACRVRFLLVPVGDASMAVTLAVVLLVTFGIETLDAFDAPGLSTVRQTLSPHSHC